jgi:hypothetical protein
MNNQDKFVEASTKERKLMKQLFEQFNVDSYIFTPADSMDREEGFYTGSTTNIPYIFEVKNRTIASTTYDTIMIEESKVKYLLTQAKERNEKAVIFFFFRDGYWMHQELDHNQFYSTVTIPMPITTMGSNNRMVLKECIEFPINKESLKKYQTLGK